MTQETANGGGVAGCPTMYQEIEGANQPPPAGLTALPPLSALTGSAAATPAGKSVSVSARTVTPSGGLAAVVQPVVQPLFSVAEQLTAADGDVKHTGGMSKPYSIICGVTVQGIKCAKACRGLEPSLARRTWSTHKSACQ